ncbi:MAG: hypothetical protein EOP84_04510 [Verrucomicrobiaceae bacterium]|nr:MAG: hypothetical protein EOP84_04510 [Verrucomicrobiaceae bacterium]
MNNARVERSAGTSDKRVTHPALGCFKTQKQSYMEFIIAISAMGVAAFIGFIAYCNLPTA